MEYLHQLFGILLHRRYLFSPTYQFILYFIYEFGLMDIYFVLWVTMQYYLICCWNCSSYGHWLLFHLIPGSLWHHSHYCGFFASVFLTSGTTRCSGFILHISFSSPRVSLLLQGTWFFLLENSFKNQGLGPGCAQLLLGICHFKALLPERARKYVLLTCAYTHMYKYFYR